jgi:hypothetical protein
MAKPSEKYSPVPDFLRDKFRKYKEQEREMEMERERKNRENAAPTSNVSESDRRALNELIDQSASADDQEMYRGKGYRKGGMVKKPKSTSRRGDGICTRGYTKGKMY